ncbi:maestro heat-like repeat-containing protein family member 2B-like [Platysternon megacephalum]|uniref:Maestro heat-like repeat-containing protein family member 2B-like n=1 Tax=Platysternon megacephalum TaxID=55544 RepID=A0A4D9DP40_9SAUR|nr:maestro heat-like repeat-containing protein family member 2B-like [Platysternon megacephalum]
MSASHEYYLWAMGTARRLECKDCKDNGAQGDAAPGRGRSRCTGCGGQGWCNLGYGAQSRGRPGFPRWVSEGTARTRELQRQHEAAHPVLCQVLLSNSTDAVPVSSASPCNKPAVCARL